MFVSSATAESAADGGGDTVRQQTGWHKTFRRKYADENAKQTAQGSLTS